MIYPPLNVFQWGALNGVLKGVIDWVPGSLIATVSFLLVINIGYLFIAAETN